MSEPRSLWPSSAVAWESQTASTVDDKLAEVRTIEERVSLHFAELSDPVFRYLAFGCRDASDAEELTQETFLRLYRELSRGGTVTNVRHWIFKVARNLMLDHAKSRRRHAHRLCELPEGVEEIARSGAESPEEKLIADARREMVRTALRGLTDRQRECIHLRSQGLRLREIGDILGMDPRRVAEALNRAVTALQRTLNI